MMYAQKIHKRYLCMHIYTDSRGTMLILKKSVVLYSHKLQNLEKGLYCIYEKKVIGKVELMLYKSDGMEYQPRR